MREEFMKGFADSATEFKVRKDEYDPEDYYPPKGTPNAALLFVIDAGNYHVMAHTGRFFHAQCCCVGVDGEEVGIEGVPEEPGIWVFEKGEVWTSTDWETGVVDDWSIGGDFRRPRPEDFRHFGYDVRDFVDLGGWNLEPSPEREPDVVAENLAKAFGGGFD